jgi:hypothetical protein
MNVKRILTVVVLVGVGALAVVTSLRTKSAGNGECRVCGKWRDLHACRNCEWDACRDCWKEVGPYCPRCNYKESIW